MLTIQYLTHGRLVADMVLNHILQSQPLPALSDPLFTTKRGSTSNRREACDALASDTRYG